MDIARLLLGAASSVLINAAVHTRPLALVAPPSLRCFSHLRPRSLPLRSELGLDSLTLEMHSILPRRRQRSLTDTQYTCVLSQASLQHFCVVRTSVSLTAREGARQIGSGSECGCSEDIHQSSLVFCEHRCWAGSATLLGFPWRRGPRPLALWHLFAGTVRCVPVFLQSHVPTDQSVIRKLSKHFLWCFPVVRCSRGMA